MDLLKTPRLRHAQLQSFTKSALNIAQGHTEIEAETTQVTNAFAPFNEAMNITRKSVNKISFRLFLLMNLNLLLKELKIQGQENS